MMSADEQLAMHVTNTGSQRSHNCTCGSNCTCGDNCQCGSGNDLDLLEEKERQDRIAHGADPILLGKLHKVQQELTHQPNAMLASLNSTAGIVKEKAQVFINNVDTESLKKGAQSAVNTTTSTFENLMSKVDTAAIKETAFEWTHATTDAISSLTGGVMHRASEYMEVAKEKLGMGEPSITALEEKERLRRMSDKIDPMMDARKHRVEDELLQNVKTAN